LAPVAVLAEDADKSGYAVLRGPVRPPPPATVQPEQSRVSLPFDIATGLLTSPASPLVAPAPLTFGGAECRRSCARDLYQCRVARDEIDCNPVWMRCVLACPDASSSLP
jgi:hypothetical protein